MGVIYMPILSIVKISVLLFILRFSGVKSSVRYIVWGNGIFNLLLMISVFFVMLFDCVPFAKNWNPTLDGYCVDVGKFSLASSIFAIVTDVVAIALPFHIFWSLNMSVRKRLGLMLIFSVSVLSVAFSCIRLYYIMGMYTTTDPDPDANYSITFTFSAIEVNLAIIAASIPALWPLVRGGVGKTTTAASSSAFNTPRRYTKNQQGWIRASDHNESPDTCDDNNDIDLNDMSNRRVQTVISRGSLPDNSDEEILHDRGSRTEDGAI
ncbi:hypothetical protein diail_6408, partial [Diaporthe ilicicola]